MEVRRTGYKFQEFDRVLQIEWTLGNTCNYNCSYCLPVLHDNSFPWIDLDESIKFIEAGIVSFMFLKFTDSFKKFKYVYNQIVRY